ncbi:MAG: hypothetical protein Q7S92_04730 [Candidatus Diapherotrites archaeon]|nr:hypothetical protein [Candidatus Diapherotrites archaeon]
MPELRTAFVISKTKRKGHTISPETKEKIRQKRLAYFKRAGTRLRAAKKARLLAEFKEIQKHGEPINVAQMHKKHRAVYQRAVAFSGSYEKFVEQVLGLKYSDVQISQDTMIARNREQAQKQVAARTPGEQIKKRRELIRGRYWTQQKIHIRVLRSVLALRLQGHSLASMGDRLGYKLKTVSQFLTELYPLVPQEVHDRLIEIRTAFLRVNNVRKLGKGPVLAGPEAAQIASAFGSDLIKTFNENYAKVKDLSLQGIWPDEISRQTGLPQETVVRLTKMFPEKVHKRSVKAKFAKFVRPLKRK